MFSSRTDYHLRRGSFFFPEKGEQRGNGALDGGSDSRKRIECGRRKASGRFINGDLVICGHTDDGVDDGDDEELQGQVETNGGLEEGRESRDL